MEEERLYVNLRKSALKFSKLARRLFDCSLSYVFLLSFLPNFLSTEDNIMITHIMPSAMSTSLASPMRSNCEIVSANVEPPRVNGEPGIILGVGAGVGMGVAVGVAVGVAGGGVVVEMGAKVGFTLGVGAGAYVGVG